MPADPEAGLSNPRSPRGRTPPVWNRSDEALVAAMAAGDADAAPAFVRRFQARVFGIALAVVGDRAAAEDVAQDAFLRAWRHAASFDGRRGSVATWLSAITRNAAIDAVRLRKSIPLDPENLASYAIVSSERAPEDGAVEGTEVARVREVLAELPADQRDALVMAVVMGRTASAVAEHQGVPLGTAKTRIRTALLKARDRLLDEEATT